MTNHRLILSLRRIPAKCSIFKTQRFLEHLGTFESLNETRNKSPKKVSHLSHSQENTLILYTNGIFV